MIDLGWMSNLVNILQKTLSFFLGTIYLQYRKIVWDSVHKLSYDIPEKILAHRKSLSPVC